MFKSILWHICEAVFPCVVEHDNYSQSVYFATNRCLINNKFSNIPSKFEINTGNNITTKRPIVIFGSCDVNVFINKRTGEVHKSRILVETIQKTDDFLNVDHESRTQTYLDAFRKKKSDALLYIHGYNTTFEQAVKSAAELAIVTKFKGPVFCYSWPEDRKNHLTFPMNPSSPE